MNTQNTELTQAFRLARRLGRRTLRRRASALLALCVFVGASVASALGFFADGVQQALDDDVARFLGAPLVVRSSRPLPDGWVQDAMAERGARTVAFTTGAIGPGGYHSVALKGVSRDYPVSGELRIRDAAGEAHAARGGPEAGAVWLDNRAMAELGAELGDRIQIGRVTFSVAAELAFEPDRLTQLQHTLPRAMLSLSDMASVGLDYAGGRGEFRYLFDGTSAQLARLEASLPGRLESAFEILKPSRGSHPFARMSQRAERFLGMVSVLVLLLCGSAAAVLANHFVRRFALPAAVLRCLGIERRVVTHALLMLLGALAALSGATGCLAGWFAQPLLAGLLRPYLELESNAVTAGPALAAMTISLLVVAAFVFPRLTALGRIPPIAALRGEVSWRGRFFLSSVLAIACVAIMLWLYSDNAQLTMILAVGVATVTLAAVLLGWLLSKTAGQLHRFTRGATRVAIRSIGRSPGRHIAPLATVAIAVMAFLVSAMLRDAFLSTYHDERLAHDGNYLFSGLPAKSADAFVAVVADAGGSVRGLYPTVRARLATINGVDVNKALARESDTREETRSPVRLSWSKTVPANNAIARGAWPVVGSNEVSVETEVMSDLGLELGDELGFLVGDDLFSARIGSTRTFVGGGSAVMFWFMFAPDTLAGFEQRFMGGIQIDGDPRSALASLAAEFPEVLVTDIEQQLSQIRGIMTALTRTMNGLMVLLLGAAMIVVLASSLAGSDAHRRRTGLLRSLGVTRGRIQRMTLVENGILGLLAGAVGILGAHLVGTLMFRYQFAMPYQIDVPNYLLTASATALAFVALGQALARATGSPLRMLQQP